MQRLAQALLADDEVHLVGAVLGQHLQVAVGASVQVLQRDHPAAVGGEGLDGELDRGPEDRAKPAVPPSRRASASCRTSRVGEAVRV